jgi:hypothetical protein
MFFQWLKLKETILNLAFEHIYVYIVGGGGVGGML